LTTWLPERCLAVIEAVATVVVVNQQYLTLIEQLVRNDRSEQEIDEIVTELVREDARALDDEIDELPSAA
jgi:hypothetical protein